MTVPAQIANPFVQILSLNGQGLNNGNVYVGTPNQDPVTNPQAVFWDQALTIPATQPLSVVGGYIMRLGSPATAYTAGLYSLKVTDKLGVQVFYCPQVPIDNFGLINVMWYGATGDGVTDDTTAIIAAFAAVPAAGGRVYFPAGKYIVSSTITVSKPTLIYGDGGSSIGVSQVLTNRTTGDIFNMTIAGSVFEDIYIGVKSGVTRSAGQNNVHMSSGASAQALRFHRCTIADAAVGIFFEPTEGWLWLSDVEIDILGAGVGQGVVMKGGSALMADNLIVATVGLPYPTGQANCGLDLSECTYGFVSNSSMLSTGVGVKIAGTATVTAGNIYFSNVGCDHCVNGWFFSTTAGTSIGNCFLSQCSGTSSVTNGLIIDQIGGVISQIAVMSGSWALNGTGISVVNATNVTITGGAVIYSNAGNDIFLDGTASRINITGNQIGLASFPSGTGVSINSAVDNVVVSGNVFASAFTTAAVANTSSGTQISFSGNVGLGTIGTSAISVTASPFTYTAGFTPEVVYVSGGTVSNITADAVSTGLTAGSFTLRSKEALVVTYTVAPTMKKTILG